MAPERDGSRDREGHSLVEIMVALAVLSLALVLALTVFDLGRKQRADWERQIDDVYALVHGMERLRREIEVSRGVAFPRASNATSAQREFLALVDPTGRVVVYGVASGDLVAETFGALAAPTVERRVMIPRVDRIIFHHRSDVLAVRFQVFMGGLSLVATVRPANAVDAASLGFAPTYGL